MRPDELADGVFTVSADDHRALFVTTSDGVVALNSFGTRERVRSYGEAIRGVATAPATVIATIDHLDHTGRTADLLGDEGQLIAHELCARVMQLRNTPGQRQADRTVGGDGEELKLGEVTFRLMYPGPTQGTGNLCVYLPERRVLFAAGPRADARYGMLPDFHLRHVTRIWRELSALDVDTVVPARGPVMSPAELARAADYVDAIRRASQEAFAEGLPIWVLEAMEQFVSERLREQFGDLDGFPRHVGIAAIRCVHHYLMGGWGMEDTAEPEELLEQTG